jgi:hypothetical protein
METKKASQAAIAPARLGVGHSSLARMFDRAGQFAEASGAPLALSPAPAR